MNKLFFLCIIVMFLMLNSCEIQQHKVFAEISYSDDSDYAYIPHKPIHIKNKHYLASKENAYFFISKLSTKDGKKLKIVEHTPIYNPKYDGSPIGLYKRFSGLPYFGDSQLIDKYSLLIEGNDNDTIIIYINPYQKGEIKIPENFIWNGEIKKTNE